MFSGNHPMLSERLQSKVHQNHIFLQQSLSNRNVERMYHIRIPLLEMTVVAVEEEEEMMMQQRVLAQQ
jgi:hypothetical protein